MTLLIDNYDSFTYNLFQLIEGLGETCKVARNDEITLQEIERLSPQRIVISPGPGTPDEAGITQDVIREFSKSLPILGVCLGHQAIGDVFGSRVVRAKRPKHGKTSTIIHKGRGLFAGLPNPLKVARYHSLVVERETLADCLEVTCETEDGVIMGLKHREFNVEGVQFHPESIATVGGQCLVAEFLKRRGA